MHAHAVNKIGFKKQERLTAMKKLRLLFGLTLMVSGLVTTPTLAQLGGNLPNNRDRAAVGNLNRDLAGNTGALDRALNRNLDANLNIRQRNLDHLQGIRQRNMDRLQQRIDLLGQRPNLTPLEQRRLGRLNQRAARLQQRLGNPAAGVPGAPGAAGVGGAGAVDAPFTIAPTPNDDADAANTRVNIVPQPDVNANTPVNIVPDDNANPADARFSIIPDPADADNAGAAQLVPRN